MLRECGSLKKADASRWIRPSRIRTGQALASGSRCHFHNRRDRAAVAPIPKGHQARLYRREANTTLHDSSQPRTFSDNVPHSKRTQLRTRRKRITGWAFHPEEPRTSVAEWRLSWSLGVDFPVATLNTTSESVRICWTPRLTRANRFDPALQPGGRLVERVIHREIRTAMFWSLTTCE